MIPPQDFELRLRTTVLAQQLPRLLKNYQLSLQLYNGIMGASAFGIGRYANEAWISSHPDIIPCDVSPYRNINIWKSTSKNKKKKLRNLIFILRNVQAGVDS